jgi:CRP/FNR family transcriptional regulator
LAGPEPATRLLAVGETLFQQGEPRSHVYRVESGALRHTIRHDDGRQDLIEFALAGDMIGLGFLERHATTAQALLETRVTLVPATEMDDLARDDPTVERRLSEAIDIEFAELRDRAVRSGHARPMERLAAYLAAVASIDASEGRSGNVIAGAPACRYVADTLGMSIDCLADALLKLEHRGVVRAGAGRLEVLNRPALEMLAEMV